MRLTILQKRPFDHGEPATLSIGEALYLWIGPNDKTLSMACPVCGEELTLANHTITWHDDTTASAYPSIYHGVSEGGAKCGAHFSLAENEIIFHSDSALPRE